MAEALHAAMKAAMQEVEDAAEGTGEPEAPDDDQTSTPEASDGGQPEGTTDDGEAPAEDQKVTAEDAPTEYFGLDLSSLEPEQRAEIVEALRKRDDHIGKLLRDRAEDEPSDEATEEEPPLEQMSDEDILRSLGLDPENPFDENAAKFAIPLVRELQQQRGALASLIEAQELAEIDRTWRQGLSAMEREFGELPKEVTHERVMEWAADNEVLNPMDAYWRIVGPGKAAAEAGLTEARAKAEALTQRKRDASTTRPSSAEADAEAPPESKTGKGATREVASKLLASLGLDT